MATDHQHIQGLLDKALVQQLSSSEVNELLEIAGDDSYHEALIRAMEIQFSRFRPDETDEVSWWRERQPVIYAQLLERRKDAGYLPAVNDAEGQEQPLKPVVAAPRVHVMRRWGWAAAMVLSFGIGAYLYTANKKNEQTLVSSQPLPADVLPGGDKAVLTLADGSTIILDSAANGNLAQQGNAAIVKLANGQIAYHVKGLAGNDVMMNTMATPKGGQYQLTLPDGSKVWLNAASSIQFPAAFAGSERKVNITGEVYFEVAKNKEKPFVVNIDGKSTVQVLGTSFNINSYSNEPTINTTLIDGKIRVTNTHGQHQTKTLEPGEQAQINTTMNITTANTQQVLAWKNGFFSFDNLGIREMARQLERWYDIDVVFTGNVSNMVMKGEMDRAIMLSDVIEFLKNYGLTAELNNKTLMISQTAKK